MSLYRRQGGKVWHYDFRLDGRRFHGSTKTADKALARQVEAAARTRALREAALGERPAMTLDEAAGRYFDEVAQHQASAVTAWDHLKHWIDVLGKDLTLDQLTDDRLARGVARLRDAPGKRRGTKRANGTVNRHLQTLRALWKRAADVWEVKLGREPRWQRHRLLEPDERIRELTEEQEAALFAALRPDPHPICRFALVSGVRLGNLRTLTWEQVDLEAGRISLRVKSKRQGGAHRSIPISSAMRAILQACAGDHPLYVFTYIAQKARKTRRRGERQPIGPSSLAKPWAAALEAAGITDYRWHDHRHTAATRAYRATGNLKAVQMMLGHADLASTMRYTHVDDEDVRAALEAAGKPAKPRDRRAG